VAAGRDFSLRLSRKTNRQEEQLNRQGAKQQENGQD